MIQITKPGGIQISHSTNTVEQAFIKVKTVMMFNLEMSVFFSAFLSQEAQLTTDFDGLEGNSSINFTAENKTQLSYVNAETLLKAHLQTLGFQIVE